jgi:hypothetical protein
MCNTCGVCTWIYTLSRCSLHSTQPVHVIEYPTVESSYASSSNNDAYLCRWVNAPACDSCDRETSMVGMGNPLPSEIEFGASRVEIYR